MLFSGMTVSELLRQSAVAWEGSDLAAVLHHASLALEEPRELRIVVANPGPDVRFVEVEDAAGNPVSPTFTRSRPDGTVELVFTDIPGAL